MTGAGAPGGLPGERPPSGGGGGRGAASAGTWSTWPGDVVQHRCVPRAAGPRPGRRERHRRRMVIGADGQVRAGQRPADAERPQRVPVGPVLHLRRIRRAGRQCRTRLRLPGGSARCTRASRRWVEARTVVRQSRSAAGSAPSEGSQVAAEIGLQAMDSARDRVVGHGHPGEEDDRSRRARGWSGGRRPAAGCRGRATAFGQARACACLGGGEQALQGNELQTEPGDLDRRAGAGEPRAGQASGSPRARTSPVATPEV